MDTEETIRMLNPLKEILEGDSLLEDIPSVSSPLDPSIFEITKTTSGEEGGGTRKRILASRLKAPVRIEGEERIRGGLRGSTLDASIERERAELPLLRKEGDGVISPKPAQIQPLKKFGHITRA